MSSLFGAVNMTMTAGRTGAYLALAAIYALIALIFAGSGGKVIPGGPFISMVGDVFPFVAGLLAIASGFVCLRSRNLPVRMVAIFFILVATVGIGAVMVNVYSFWIRPYARGDLIGWW